MANEEKLHIAIFSWLAYGHIIPYFELSKFLAMLHRHGHGHGYGDTAIFEK